MTEFLLVILKLTKRIGRNTEKNLSRNCRLHRGCPQVDVPPPADPVQPKWA